MSTTTNFLTNAIKEFPATSVFETGEENSLLVYSLIDSNKALAGIIYLNGKTRIVSVILNQYGCSETDAREALDHFIENVAKK